MEIKSSLDWDLVRAELFKEATQSKLIHFTEISHVFRNLDNEIKKLGNEEIHARITGKDRRVKEMIEKINSIIEMLEQNILLARLSS